MGADESALIDKAKAGDGKAFEQLVRLHYRAVYSTAYRYMNDHGGADDVTQDTFMKAYTALDSFRGESSFKSWLIRIAGNTALNAIRAAGGGKRQFVDIGDLEIASKHEGFTNLERSQTSELLRKAINGLPEKQKQALELRIFDDLSFQEVAEIMGSPFDTAKANFRHAILNLKKILAGLEDSQGLEIMKMSLAAYTEED
jgi:RNA polymerase sigma-70 factor (ECF subfamily)